MNIFREVLLMLDNKSLKDFKSLFFKENFQKILKIQKDYFNLEVIIRAIEIINFR